jgi:GxxExxY protein
VSFENSPVVDRVIGLAIDVHRALGPGLLESAYAHCLAHKLRLAAMPFKRQVDLPIYFEGLRIESGYRMDFVVDDVVLIELKSVERILPIHSAQILTYLKLSGLRHGLLINFNVEVLTSGLKSLLNAAATQRASLP